MEWLNANIINYYFKSSLIVVIPHQLISNDQKKNNTNNNNLLVSRRMHCAFMWNLSGSALFLIEEDVAVGPPVQGLIGWRIIFSFSYLVWVS